jgi:ATP adenylyltransferase
MDKLWAPWRSEYIRSSTTGCFLCEALKAKDPVPVLVLEQSNTAFTIMNRFPYNSGHLMIAPVRHTGDYEHLDNQEIVEMHRLLSRALKAMKAVFHPQGYNIGINLGDVAGAGVVGHVHMHVVPRWQGDTNFMPVLADTKVVIESLDNTYKLFKQALAKLDRLQ